MSRQDGVPLPGTLSGVIETRPIMIDRSLFYLIGGALSKLTDSEILEQTGALSVDVARAALSEMLYNFYVGECQTMTGAVEVIGTVEVTTELSYIDFDVSNYRSVTAHAKIRTTRADAAGDDILVTINNDVTPAHYYSEGRYGLGSQTTWSAYYIAGSQVGLLISPAAATIYSAAGYKLYSSLVFDMTGIGVSGRGYPAATWGGHTQTEIFGGNLRGFSFIGGGNYLADDKVNTVRLAPRYGAKFEYGSEITMTGVRI